MRYVSPFQHARSKGFHGGCRKHDELITMAIRIRDGENFLYAHRRHLYKLLANEKGIAHWKISAGCGIFQLAIGLSVLALKPFGIFAVLTFLTACFLGFSRISFRVRKKVANTTTGEISRNPTTPIIKNTHFRLRLQVNTKSELFNEINTFDPQITPVPSAEATGSGVAGADFCRLIQISIRRLHGFRNSGHECHEWSTN